MANQRVFLNGKWYTDDPSPVQVGDLNIGGTGNRNNFIPMIADFVTVAGSIGTSASSATSAAAAAASSASAASSSASNASTSASNAATSASNAATSATQAATNAANVTPNMLSVGAVTTGAAGSSASVSITGTTPAQVLNFIIPKGDQGVKGDTGDIASVSSKSALKALSTSTGKCFLNLSGSAGLYVWDAGVPYRRALGDIDEHKYISPNTAVDGAWVRQNLSFPERDAINKAYRRSLLTDPLPEDTFNPAIPAVQLGTRQINWNSKSEDLSDPHYNRSGSLGESMVWRGIKLQKVIMSGFYGGIGDIRPADFNLKAGVKYIASYWASAPKPVVDDFGIETPNSFVWMKNNSGNTWSHGAKLLFQTPRRVWSIIEGGTTAYTTRTLGDPTVALSSQPESGQSLAWIFSGNGLGNSTIPEVWMGGLQLEEAPNQTEKMGIVVVGTSIDVSGGGAGNGKDHWFRARGWARWLEGLLNVPIFPASIGGQTSTDINSRFDTDIAPLAVNAKYIILCCNVNDFGTSFDSATYRANWASIYSKAIAAGWSASQIIITTIQPQSSLNATTGQSAIIAENAYIKATYRNVIDKGEILRDAIDTNLLAADFDYDGVHQNAIAQKALGFGIYNKYRNFFSFDNVPGLYQKLTSVDNIAQSLGAPVFDSLKGAVRLSAASHVTAYRDNDIASAPILFFDGTAGSVKTFQLPCPKFARNSERVNTEVFAQTIVNNTSDNKALIIQYYKIDGAGSTVAVGSAVFVAAGATRTIYCDGVGMYTQTPASQGWQADTGSSKFSSNTTYNGGTAPASYDQGLMQTMLDTMKNNSQTIKALKDLLISAGIMIV